MNPFVREDIVQALVADIQAIAPSPGDHGLPVLDQSPRARAIRRIAEIAGSRGWHMAVTHVLDHYRAAYVSDLSDGALWALRDQMEAFEDCVQHGHSTLDAPPAT